MIDDDPLLRRLRDLAAHEPDAAAEASIHARARPSFMREPPQSYERSRRARSNSLRWTTRRTTTTAAPIRYTARKSSTRRRYVGSSNPWSRFVVSPRG